MMKKITYFILFCMICTGLCLPTSAIQSDGSNIAETIDADGSVIRTLYKANSPVVLSEEAGTNFSEVKANLMALGIDANVIDKMSVTELQDYSNSVQITTIERYMKSDIDGNIEILPKEDAIAAASQIVINETDNYRDQYMLVILTIAKIPNDRVRLTVDANWLTEPNFRGKDTLGACAKYVTVFNHSREGYLAYTVEQRSQSGAVIEASRKTKNISKFENASNGQFYGAGMIFDLPNDTYAPSYGVYEEAYTDFHAHFTYDGEIELPDQRLNFNATGTYTHTTVSLTINPSLSISVNDSVGSISPSLIINKKCYTAQLEVSYTP